MNKSARGHTSRLEGTQNGGGEQSPPDSVSERFNSDALRRSENLKSKEKESILSNFLSCGQQ